jgi:hypothetical protein
MHSQLQLSTHFTQGSSSCPHMPLKSTSSCPCTPLKGSSSCPHTPYRGRSSYFHPSHSAVPVVHKLHTGQLQLSTCSFRDSFSCHTFRSGKLWVLAHSMQGRLQLSTHFTQGSSSCPYRPFAWLQLSTHSTQGQPELSTHSAGVASAPQIENKRAPSCSCSPHREAASLVCTLPGRDGSRRLHFQYRGGSSCLDTPNQEPLVAAITSPLQSCYNTPVQGSPAI